MQGRGEPERGLLKMEVGQALRFGARRGHRQGEVAYQRFAVVAIGPQGRVTHRERALVVFFRRLELGPPDRVEGRKRVRVGGQPERSDEVVLVEGGHRCRP